MPATIFPSGGKKIDLQFSFVRSFVYISESQIQIQFCIEILSSRSVLIKISEIWNSGREKSVTFLGIPPSGCAAYCDPHERVSAIDSFITPTVRVLRPFFRKGVISASKTLNPPVCEDGFSPVHPDNGITVNPVKTQNYPFPGPFFRDFKSGLVGGPLSFFNLKSLHCPFAGDFNIFPAGMEFR